MAHPRAVGPDDWAHPTPRYVVWELTLRCDQACAHCGSRAGLARRVELDTEQALQVVDQLAEIGVREVTLIGGEAYLRRDWLVIARAITDRGMRCTLVTAGRRLTLARAQALADAGITSISVSVDGLEVEHDWLRGVKGSWRAALAALDAVRGAGVIPTVNTQINARTRQHLPALGQVLADHGVRAWQFQLTVPMGRAADQQDLIIQPHQLPGLFDELMALSSQVEARGVRMTISNNMGYYGPLEGALRFGGAWMGCQAGRFSVGIQSDGRFKPCASLPAEYAETPITQVPLAQVLQTGRNPIARRTVDDLWGFCRTCYYADTCMGGCPWMAHTFLGRPGNNPFCVHRALTLAERGLGERMVRVADAPGERFDHGEWRVEELPLSELS